MRALFLVFLTSVTILAFQNCGQLKSIKSMSSSRVFSSSVEMTSLPSNFGAALQQPLYNPKGSINNVLFDGATHSLELGIQTFKINLSRGSLLPANNANFYRLPNTEVSNITTLQQAVNSPSIKKVLDLPFKTIFIDADNISIDGRTNNYWNFESHPMQNVDRSAIYQETYDMAVALLTNYQNENRIFIIQNHEGDSHTTMDANPHSIPTEIGLKNFEEYWSIRQEAISNARADVSSQAKVYHMCEVVSVKRPMLAAPGTPQFKSLTTSVLPKVSCDLIGYSAHDTAIDGSNGVNLDNAIHFIRSNSQQSPTFGTNQVVISEIAVPEDHPDHKQYYLQQLDTIADKIAQYLRDGMPWVVYWQLYDNDNIGNYLVLPNGNTSIMYQTLLSRFQSSLCQDKNLIANSDTEPLPSGVSAEVKKTYWELFGGIGSYLEGARFITQLRNQGYTMESLRRDLINDVALRTAINILYQSYLNRDIHETDFLNVKAYLQNGGNIRALELELMNSSECSTSGGSTSGGSTSGGSTSGGSTSGGSTSGGSTSGGSTSGGSTSGGSTSGGSTSGGSTSGGSTSGGGIVNCTDQLLIPNTDNQSLPSGVSAEVKKTYWELFGGIGSYLEGARFITQLRNQGYTMDSLRRDLINDVALRTAINSLYQLYLKRNVAESDFLNVKEYLRNGGNIRALELQIINSNECKNQ